MALLIGSSVQQGTLPSAYTIGGQTTLTVALGKKPTTTLICNVVALTLPLPSQPTTLTLSPASVNITTQNGTQQFVATVLDQYNVPYSGATINWSSSNPNAVSISGTGLATALQLGANVTITASVPSSSASGTATVTTPASGPATITISAGYPNLGAAAAAAGWTIGLANSELLGYEQHPGYQQLYQQLMNGGSILGDTTYREGWISAVTSATTVTTNFKGALDYDLAHAQAIGAQFKAYILDGSAANQWTGLTTYCTSSGTATSLLSAISTAITSHYNTPGTPAAYNAGTTYTYGNTVTFNGFKWTYIAQSNFSGITPALGATTASGEYAWIRTSAGAIHSYVILSQGIAFGSAVANPFTNQLGSPNTWLPTFAQQIYAGDPGAKIEVSGGTFGYDGTGYGTPAQATAVLSLMSAIATAGSVGGASNLTVGIEGHVKCSLLQNTTGTVAQFNLAQMTALFNSITSAGYKYAITEFDVQDDMYIGTGPAGIALRDTAVAQAYTNYLLACDAASAKPDHFMIWGLRDPESGIVVNSVNPRSDGLAQRPLLFADYFGSTAANGTPIPTLKPSYYAVINYLAGKPAPPSSITLNDAYQHQFVAYVKDAWGNQNAAPITTTSNNANIVVVPSIYMSALAGGVSNTTVTVSTTSAPIISASITVSSSPAVLTYLTLSPAVATLTTGTIQLTTSGLDQYGLPNATSPGALSWISANTGVVTVSGTGLVSYAGNGTTYVEAYNQAATGVSTITAQATLVPTISGISPSSTSLTAQGSTVTLVATVVDQFGHPFALTTPLVWTSSDSGHISVVSTGTYTAAASALGTGGNAIITATIAGSSPLQTATATVSTPLAAVTSITLALASGTSINDALNHVITPTVLDQFGGVVSPGILTWASDNAQVTVDQTGTIQALSGSQTAHITATAQGVTGSLTVTTTTPALTAVTLSPASTVLAPGGTVTEVPTPVDQFGNAFNFAGFTAGGAISLTAGNTAYCANVASIQALTTCIDTVWRVRVDNWAALGGFNVLPVGTIDDGTGGGANRKISVTLENNGAGLFRAGMSNANVSLKTGNIPAASMPVNGQDIIVRAWYRSAGGGGDNHGVSVYKGDGSNALIDPNATVLDTAGRGALPGTGANGQVGLNVAAGTTVTRSEICQGVGVFNTLRAAGSESAKPSVSDATCLYYCAFSDATSGTTPTSATAQVGSNAMALPVGQYAWTTDTSPGAWNGAPNAYTWTSSLSGIGITVDGSGHVAASSTASGTSTITAALQGTAVAGTALVTCQAASIPSSLTLNPTTVTINGIGSTTTITATVKDQYLNVMTSGFTLNPFSQTPSICTVTGSPPLVVTAVAGGVGTVFVGVIGTALSQICTVTVNISTLFNQPGGMTTQIATGKMTAIPSNFSIFSPSSPTAQGETSANLTVTPAPDTGLRINYPTNLSGGWSPVRFAPPNFASGGTPQGTGYLYARMRIRYSANWTCSTNASVKIYEPRSENQGSGAGATSNPVVFGYVGAGTPTRFPVGWAKQGPNGLFANYAPASPNAGFIISDGNWHYVEVSTTPETSIGAGDGVIDIWVDQVNHFQQTGVQFLTAGMTVGWPSIIFDPTYGGGTASPPVNMYWDFDDIFIATK